MKSLCRKISKTNYNKFTEKVKKVIFDPRYKKLDLYIQHGNTTIYEHSIRVAYTSFVFSELLCIDLNIDNLIFGALLHDYIFYDWHTHGDKLHGFHHPSIAFKNAKRDFDINDEVGDIILKHMWPLTLSSVPKSREALIVCFVDKYCSVQETLKKIINNKF